MPSSKEEVRKLAAEIEKRWEEVMGNNFAPMKEESQHLQMTDESAESTIQDYLAKMEEYWLKKKEESKKNHPNCKVCAGEGGTAPGRLKLLSSHLHADIDKIKELNEKSFRDGRID